MWQGDHGLFMCVALSLNNLCEEGVKDSVKKHLHRHAHIFFSGILIHELLVGASS